MEQNQPKSKQTRFGNYIILERFKRDNKTQKGKELLLQLRLMK